jgi:hypothetical protein
VGGGAKLHLRPHVKHAFQGTGFHEIRHEYPRALHGDLLHRVLCKPDTTYRKYGHNLTYALQQCVAFLVNDQRDAQFFSMYLLLFLTLYMFRAHRAHNQERQVVSIQPLVAVTLCRWPCHV